MRTGFILLLLFIFITLVLLLGPRKCWADCSTPENFLIFREPGSSYSDQHVNFWVDKKWKSDGSRIPCRIEYYTPECKNLIIYSHGNAENMLNCMQFSRELSIGLESNVLCYDYSGYGLNHHDRFERSEEGVNLTLKTIFEEMVQNRGYDPKNILCWGYSLGSGPSTWLASYASSKKFNLRGLILQSAFSSLVDVMKEKSFQHVDKIFRNRWNNERELAKVKCPTLILHGKNDTLVGVHHATKLKQAKPDAKVVILQHATHTDFTWTQVISEVYNWLKFENV